MDASLEITLTHTSGTAYDGPGWVYLTESDAYYIHAFVRSTNGSQIDIDTRSASFVKIDHTAPRWTRFDLTQTLEKTVFVDIEVQDDTSHQD